MVIGHKFQSKNYNSHSLTPFSLPTHKRGSSVGCLLLAFPATLVPRTTSNDTYLCWDNYQYTASGSTATNIASQRQNNSFLPLFLLAACYHGCGSLVPATFGHPWPLEHHQPAIPTAQLLQPPNSTSILSLSSFK